VYGGGAVCLCPHDPDQAHVQRQNGPRALNTLHTRVRAARHFASIRGFESFRARIACSNSRPHPASVPAFRVVFAARGDGLSSHSSAPPGSSVTAAQLSRRRRPRQAAFARAMRRPAEQADARPSRAGRTDGASRARATRTVVAVSNLTASLGPNDSFLILFDGFGGQGKFYSS
jgi:hypothetical protein